MALSQLEARLERSIYEAFRLILVSEGYLPDITDEGRYPFVNGKATAVANANWEADLGVIRNQKGFAIELFNYSSSDAKGTKKVPRIAIETNRSMPSELGAPAEAYSLPHPTDQTKIIKQPLPYRASTFYFDIHLVGNSAIQMRVLNAVLAVALAMVKYIPYYDNNQETFFIHQTGFFEVPGQTEGLEEKVYQYEVPDLYDLTLPSYEVSKIKQIDISVEPLLPGEEPDLSTPASGDSIHIEDGEVDFT